MGAGENVIKKKVLEILEGLGIEAWLVQSGMVKVRGAYMHLAPKGTSDVIGYMPYTGRMLAVEVKDYGKLPTKEQIEFLARVSKAGGIALIVDDLSIFWDKMKLFLEEDKKGRKSI